MATNLRTDILELGATVQLLTGSADPSAGGGVAANVGSGYYRTTNGELWIKTGAGNTAWTQLAVAASTISGSGFLFFGDGIDGNMTFDGAAAATGAFGLSLAPAAGVYTLTRDIFCNNLTLSVGATIRVNGFRIFVLNTATISGIIHADGGNGANAVGDAGGNGGTAQTVGTIAGGSNGGNGVGAPTNSCNIGIAPATTHLGASTTTATPAAPNGGVLQGGAGGNASNGGSGCNVNTIGITAANAQYFHSIDQALRGVDRNNAILPCGSSGASGRSGNAGGTGGSGGGGASGAALMLSARVITGAGTVRSNGGNAGTVGGTGSGGSGGGAGGVVAIVTTSTFPLSITVQANGGNGSAAGGAGASTAGGNGGAGMIYSFKV